VKYKMKERTIQTTEVIEGSWKETVKERWVPIPEWKAINKDTGQPHDGVWVVHEITYYGQLPQSVHWGRINTHSGVLTENAAQATAADFLTHGVLNAESQGFLTLFKVHDQSICEYRPDLGQTVEKLVEAFTKVPEWAPGFPLAAEAGIVDFYTK